MQQRRIALGRSASAGTRRPRPVENDAQSPSIMARHGPLTRSPDPGALQSFRSSLPTAREIVSHLRSRARSSAHHVVVLDGQAVAFAVSFEGEGLVVGVEDDAAAAVIAQPVAHAVAGEDRPFPVGSRPTVKVGLDVALPPAPDLRRGTGGFRVGGRARTLARP